MTSSTEPPDTLEDASVAQARSIAAKHYQQIVQQTGSARPRRVFAHMINRLPFPLERVKHSSDAVGGAVTTGHAWTDYAAGRHYLSISDQLPGLARIHTLSHEMYHLAFHTPTPDNIDELVEYYSSVLDSDQRLPLPVLRKLIEQEASRPHQRAELESPWEVEAEWFAMLVATRRDMVSLRPSRSRLMRALGAPRA